MLFFKAKISREGSTAVLFLFPLLHESLCVVFLVSEFYRALGSGVGGLQKLDEKTF